MPHTFSFPFCISCSGSVKMDLEENTEGSVNPRKWGYGADKTEYAATTSLPREDEARSRSRLV